MTPPSIHHSPFTIHGEAQQLNSAMPNRLAKESSPYLLQHKDNPVDWYPWGEEAFEKAKQEGKPVFLSIGYSSCHWCHVMEHESFENHEIAGILNKYFVSVKVDREERPDVDEAYMTAVQYSTGRGGWPMSVFLTPDKKPFFAGTYFPKEDRQGVPGFRTLVSQIASTWSTRKAELLKVSDEFAIALTDILSRPFPASDTKIDRDMLDNVVKTLASEFDPENGGTLGAPKFPPHTGLEFLMRYALEPEVPQDLREAALTMALVTLERMCLGGIQDHVGGGFHRYSTDEHWVLPHFEKMLYDNALILRNLQLAIGIAQQLDERLTVLFSLALAGIMRWISTEMLSPDGLFYSALDADSEGVEGKFYTWTTEEIRKALRDKADKFLTAYNCEPGGNFLDEATHEKTGQNVLFLTEEWDLDYQEELKALAAVRNERVKPGLDNKAIVSWNSLLIAGMPSRLSAMAAAKILETEKQIGYLPHLITDGVPSGQGFLDDYAYFAYALLTWAQIVEYGGLPADGENDRPALPVVEWRAEGERLVQEMIARFYDEENGGFFYTSSNHEELFGRTKPAFDQPLPSANSVAIRCLLAVGDLDRAKKGLQSFSGWMERAPTATEGLLTVAIDFLELQSEDGSVVLSTSDDIGIKTNDLNVPDNMPTVEMPKSKIEIRLESRELRADERGIGYGKVIIQVPEGLHINSSDPPARWLTPTRISITPIVGEISYLPATNDRYEGQVEIPFQVQLPDREEGADFEVAVTYQACTESECLLPEEKKISAVVYR